MEFRKIRDKLRNVVGSPDISISYNVITSKHDSDRIGEKGTLFEGQQGDCREQGIRKDEKCLQTRLSTRAKQSCK